MAKQNINKQELPIREELEHAKKELKKIKKYQNHCFLLSEGIFLAIYLSAAMAIQNKLITNPTAYSSKRVTMNKEQKSERSLGYQNKNDLEKSELFYQSPWIKAEEEALRITMTARNAEELLKRLETMDCESIISSKELFNIKVEKVPFEKANFQEESILYMQYDVMNKNHSIMYPLEEEKRKKLDMLAFAIINIFGASVTAIIYQETHMIKEEEKEALKEKIRKLETKE